MERLDGVGCLEYDEDNAAVREDFIVVLAFKCIILYVHNCSYECVQQEGGLEISRRPDSQYSFLIVCTCGCDCVGVFERERERNKWTNDNDEEEKSSIGKL